MKVFGWIAAVVIVGFVLMLAYGASMSPAQIHEMNQQATQDEVCKRLQIGADTGAQRLAAKDLCDRLKESRR